MAVAMLVLSVGVSVAPAGPVGGRFAADEILVKLRASADDAADEAARLSPAGPEQEASRDVRVLQGRFRIREIRPITGREGPRQRMDAAAPRLSRRRALIQRRVRAAMPDEPDGPGRVYRVKLDLRAGETPEQALAAYRSRSDVEYAEFNPIISICVAPDDPFHAEQWSLNTIRAYEAWDTCRGGHEVVVAIIDTGVDYHHRDLLGNLWMNEAESNGVPGVDDDKNGYVDDLYGWNFAYNTSDPLDDHGHGTHVAGTVAAMGNNGLDIAGVCWSARIMALKILGADGDGSAADAVPAIYYAVANGADIISSSWGGHDASDALKEAIAYAHSRGVLVMAAAGNEGSSVPYYPAAYPKTLSVAATDASDSRWHLSNYGNWVDMAAPGRDILSLRAGGPQAGDESTLRMTGTSMAVPHASGACALLLSANPFLTCDEVHEIMVTTGDPISPGICASNGRLNLYEALRAAIPSEGTIRLDRDRYARDGRIGIFLADWHLRGLGRQTVLVQADSGDEESVTLEETPVSLGVFHGEIVGRAGTAILNDGVLQLSDGQSLRARYFDGDDGLGHAGRWREATAGADFVAPSIVDLQVQIRGLVATVSLLASEAVRAEVRYGVICGGPYDLAENSSRLTDLHSVDLSGLKPQTKYCFVVVLTDEAGNETLADDDGQPYSFVTGGRLRGLCVPSAYPTIQSALDAASDGDTIWVAEGTYCGDGNLDIDFHGKAVTLRSENGPAGCIIDCQGKGRAFYFGSGETADSVLDGFTIGNGGNTDYGAGIRCMGSSPTIRNCVFVGNAAGQYGGGLCNCYGSHPTVIDCVFRENSCSASALFGRGGGMANRHGSHPIVSNCVFLDNSAKYTAGALGNFDASSPRVTRCVFSGNQAAFSGGAVGNWEGCAPVFRECLFSANIADDDGGAVANMPGSSAVFSNCIFNGNLADGFGGAMKNYAAQATITNCTFHANRAQWSCGGLWSGADCEVRLDNCILWGNTDTSSGQRVERAQIVTEGGETQIRYCDIQGWTGELGGIGNFGLDPRFANAAEGDFHLQSEGRRWDRAGELWTCDSVTSPCIDAGHPAYSLGRELETLPDDPDDTPAGNKRINVGAFGGMSEASLAPPGRTRLADVNNDGVVNWMDFAHMAARWTHTADRCETDLTRDGRTDGMDLARLADEWRQ